MDLSRLNKAYDPEDFRKNGYELVDMLADYLQATRSKNQMPANPWTPPLESLGFWQNDFDQAGEGAPAELFRQILERSVHLHHPKYMGHQISPAAPVAALAGLLNDLLNNGMGVYEMGVSGTAVEHLVVRVFAQALGFNERAGGILTSGGSLANLTALLTARSVKAKAPVWQNGGGPSYALMVSEEAHYCVDRAVRIMGWGEAGIIKIPVNEQFQMRTELLPAFYEAARANGLEVIAVVGSACSTSTGAFDDLEAIADFCQSSNLWFHVDGAHGAALALSAKYRHVVSGLSRADSVAMDFHKMLMTPSVATALIYKDGRDSFRTFSQQAQYLFDRTEEGEWYNLAKRTFECTKLMMGLKVYAILRTYGMAFFEDCVTRQCDLGQEFSELIHRSADFELATKVHCNIVCFRYRPRGQRTDLNAVNETIRKHLLQDGTFYIVQTRLKEESWMRCTLSNPFTTLSELEELLSLIRNYAQENFREN